MPSHFYSRLVSTKPTLLFKDRLGNEPPLTGDLEAFERVFEPKLNSNPCCHAGVGAFFEKFSLTAHGALRSAVTDTISKRRTHSSAHKV